MVAMTEQRESDAPLADSFFVRSRNRVFPQVETHRVQEAVADLQVAPQPRELASRLQTILSPRLPFARFDSEATSEPARLVAAYVDSLQVVQNWQGELSEFVSALCVVNLEFRQESGTTNESARDTAVSSTLREMRERGQFPIEPVSNALRAELVALPVDQLHARLTVAAKKAVEEFSHQVVGVLQSLVDQHLLGLVEWVGSQACRYHFFKEVVIQENDGLKTSRGDRYRDSASATGWSATTTERISGRHLHRRARHEHHVMHAFETSIINSKVVVPADVERLLTAIPDWLRDSVRIIDGQIIRERIIEQDYREEAWSQVSVRDEPVTGPDPALVIDEFVLTGWGPREITQEQSRQQSEQHIDRGQQARRESTVWLAATVAVHLIACGLAWRSWHGDSSLRVAATVVTLAGIFGIWNVIRLLQQSRAFPNGVTAAVIGTLVISLAPVGLQTLIASVMLGSVTGFLLGVSCVVAAVVVTRVLLSKTSPS